MTSLLFGTEQEDGFARGTFCHIRSAADVLNEQENCGGDSSWLGSPGIAPPLHHESGASSSSGALGPRAENRDLKYSQAWKY